MFPLFCTHPVCECECHYHGLTTQNLCCDDCRLTKTISCMGLACGTGKSTETSTGLSCVRNWAAPSLPLLETQPTPPMSTAAFLLSLSPSLPSVSPSLPSLSLSSSPHPPFPTFNITVVFSAQPQTNSTKNSIVTSPKGNIPSPALVFTSLFLSILSPCLFYLFIHLSGSPVRLCPARPPPFSRDHVFVTDLI